MAFMLLATLIASIAPVLAVLHGIHPGDEWEVGQVGEVLTDGKPKVRGYTWDEVQHKRTTATDLISTVALNCGRYVEWGGSSITC